MTQGPHPEDHVLSHDDLPLLVPADGDAVVGKDHVVHHVDPNYTSHVKAELTKTVQRKLRTQPGRASYTVGSCRLTKHGDKFVLAVTMKKATNTEMAWMRATVPVEDAAKAAQPTPRRI